MRPVDCFITLHEVPHRRERARTATDRAQWVERSTVAPLGEWYDANPISRGAQSAGRVDHSPSGVTAVNATSKSNSQAESYDMSRFAGMNAAKAFTQGSYFDHTRETGEYDCVIKDVIYKGDGKKGPCVIVELEVTASNSPNLPIGTKKSYVQSLNDRTIAFPNLIAFLGAVCKLDPNNAAHCQIINTQLAPQSEAMLEQACEQKTLNGQPVHVAVTAHTTKKKEVITRLRFSPVGAPAA